MALLEESEQGRYIILGTIDGILAILGIIVGLSSATLDPGVIIKAALGGGIALRGGAEVRTYFCIEGVFRIVILPFHVRLDSKQVPASGILAKAGNFLKP